MRAKCHDCGTLEGQLHVRGCDMERCPFCGGQLITCDCSYSKLGYTCDLLHPTYGLPKDVYENGLPRDQRIKWERILEKKGRIPYIQWPNMCTRCGALWPEMFMVPDKEWVQVVGVTHHQEILCRRCFDEIKEYLDDD